jgi:hypothetical protein
MCWAVGTGEEIEVSKNPGYAEKTALGYVAEDARRFRAATKAADDVVFEEFASKKAEDFAALSAADKARSPSPPPLPLPHLAFLRTRLPTRCAVEEKSVVGCVMWPVLSLRRK